MKKIISITLGLLCSLFIFAGCGYSGSQTVVGIAFTSPTYYVDLNVPFKLGYKILPSSASAAEPQFEVSAGFDYVSYINFDRTNGVITVIDRRFEQINVKIEYGSYSDTCTVVLKQYPSSISFNEQEVYLSAGAMTELSCFGKFGTENIRLDHSYYHAIITSSDPTVVTIENQNKLLVKSTGKRGKSTITVTICNSDGEIIEGLTTSVDVVITNNVSDAAVVIDGHHIRDFSQTLSINKKVNDTFTINPIFVDAEGFVVDHLENTIISSNSSVLEVENNDGEFLIRVKGAGETQLLVTSNGYDANGNLVVFTIKCQVITST